MNAEITDQLYWMASKSQESSCLYLLRAGITNVLHCTLSGAEIGIWGILHARQLLSQLSYIPLEYTF